MKKYIVTIEFRYSDAPRHEDDFTSRNKEITIGIYDDFDSACIGGNDLIKSLESKFKLHVFPKGRGTAKKERFSKNGGAFGSKRDLITNLAYLQTPFAFFAKIKTLNYDPIDEVLDDVVSSCKRSRAYKLAEAE